MMLEVTVLGVPEAANVGGLSDSLVTAIASVEQAKIRPNEIYIYMPADRQRCQDASPMSVTVRKLLDPLMPTDVRNALASAIGETLKDSFPNSPIVVEVARPADLLYGYWEWDGNQGDEL